MKHILLASAMTFGLVLPASAQDTITLKLATSTAPSHQIEQNGTQKFMERVKALSDGKITFEYYPAGQLGKVDQMLDVVKSGAVQISLLIGGNADMPLFDLFTMPGYEMSSCKGSAVYRELAQPGNPIAETDYASGTVKFLFVNVPSPNEIASKDKPVVTPEDFQGMKFRVGASGVGLTISSLGGVPIRLAGPETYESYSRGTVDAVVLPLTYQLGYQLEQISKFTTSGLGWNSGAYLWVMNGDTWRNLPPEAQKVLEQASSEIEQELCAWTDEDVTRARKALADAGVTVNELTAEQRAAINEKVKPVVDEWIKDKTAQGIAASEAFDAFVAAVNRN